MDGFWSSFSKWSSEKTSSPLYFTYIGFFVAWNWKFFQIIFLEHSSLFISPRIEYISSELSFSLGNPILDFLANDAWHLIPPAIFTWVTIMYLPRVQKWALEKYLESRFERKRMFETKRHEHDQWILSLERKKEKTLESIATSKASQAEKRKTIKGVTTQEELWEQEFEDFKKNHLYPKIRQVTEVLYNNGGKTQKFQSDYGYQRLIDSNILALVHTKGLVTISGSGGSEQIALTEKGKFFVSRYLQESQ
ncbi:hypothetical protein A3D66_02935 [Candidatus Kaiserbacteria bacterium RIFCSPHIGHO2_02_FULL_50_9]|nr:MAG: hypothetical protein A2761_01315 [Candidatus Kaiserbacteria bacterium RIFCSPHIGHO2_01_FULL_51_33]OGG63366.1 MAG: hypothetical protein A3D66_02935 [Candidatus Kaiserbacteria bacterium RIFCSPHIGHO2_02_FULL_50_9]